MINQYKALYDNQVLHLWNDDEYRAIKLTLADPSPEAIIFGAFCQGINITTLYGLN